METLTCIALARELDRALKGMRIVCAEQADAGETLLLQLRGRRGVESRSSSGWLTMSSCLRDAVMFFHDEKPALMERAWPAPLSEHVEGMYVGSVAHCGMDRVIALSMSSSPGAAGGPVLHVELFSPRLRAYLTAPGSGTVIEAHAARRGTDARDRASEAVYHPPATQGHKLDPLKAGAATIREELPDDPTEDDLVTGLFGMGRTLAREVLARSAAGSLGPADVLKDMLERAVEAIEPIERDAGGFVVVPSRRSAPGAAQGEAAGAEDGEIGARGPMALAFRPTSLPHDELVTRATVNDAVRFAFLSCRALAIDSGRRRAAEKTIRAQLKRTAKTRAALVEELAEAGHAGEYRLKGELILAHMGRIPKGAGQVELPHQDAPGGALRVRLDPRLGPPGNAQAYFKRARKLEKKLGALPARIQELERRESKLRRELSSATSGDAPAPYAKRAGGAAGGASAEPHGGPPRRAKWPPGVAPRRLVSSDGWTMYVGRDNRENDHLTFAFAKADDLWFHAHGVTGSHVILRREGRKAMPSKRCVAEAAAVAAYYSKGRTSQTVAVVFTEKKYVRKPRKGRPGTALYSHERTVMVAPGLPPGGGTDSG
jgi:predicted ribosome quality control (RQC) complex YloA/Tae2 family protein